MGECTAQTQISTLLYPRSSSQNQRHIRNYPVEEDEGRSPLPDPGGPANRTPSGTSSSNRHEESFPFQQRRQQDTQSPSCDQDNVATIGQSDEALTYLDVISMVPIWMEYSHVVDCVHDDLQSSCLLCFRERLKKSTAGACNSIGHLRSGDIGKQVDEPRCCLVDKDGASHAERDHNSAKLSFQIG